MNDMESKELRIGNFVFDYFGNVSVVDSVGCYNNIRISNSAFTRKSLNLSDDDCSGIPLTEDWLLKFGFEKKQHEEKINPEYCIGINNVTQDVLMAVGTSEAYGFYYRNAGHTIPYVHSLMNLYHSLTGEELKLK